MRRAVFVILMACFACLSLLSACTIETENPLDAATRLADTADYAAAEAKLAAAMQSANKLSKIDQLDGWRMLADLRIILGDDKGAVSALKKAVALAPDDWTLVSKLATHLQASGDEQSIIRVYERYLKQVPEDEAALEALINLLESQEKYSDALPYYPRLAALRSNDEQAQAALALALTHLEQSEEVMAQIEEQIALYPDNEILQSLHVQRRKTQGQCALNFIAAGPTQSAAIDEFNRLWMWGSNLDGAVGDGSIDWNELPMIVREQTAAIALGGGHDLFGYTLAIDMEGKLWGWGANIYRTIADVDTTLFPEPQPILDDVVAVSAGATHAMAIRSDGTLWAWGDDTYGQLMDGISATSQIMADVKQAIAGYGFSLALLNDGTLYLWGAQADDPNAQANSQPIKIDEGVQSIAAGRYCIYALHDDGTVMFWDDKDGENAWSGAPPQLLAENIVKISANGGTHVLMLDTQGTLLVSGLGSYGQLGLGNTFTAQQPQMVMQEVVDMAAGAVHSLAITQDGKLWAWGAGEGRLGLKSGADKDRPNRVRFSEPE